MKNLLLLLALSFSLEACAWGSPRPRPVRKDADKRFRFCEDSEVQNGSAVGKVCSRACMRKEKDTCKMWNTVIKDLTKEEDFKFFRDSTFILIDEDNL